MHVIRKHKHHHSICRQFDSLQVCPVCERPDDNPNERNERIKHSEDDRGADQPTFVRGLRIMSSKATMAYRYWSDLTILVQLILERSYLIQQTNMVFKVAIIGGGV